MTRVMKGIESMSLIDFSQKTGKASEPAEDESDDQEPDLPPIPEGGTSESVFYYTRVVTRRVDNVYDGYYIKKEFALRDSPSNKHEITARFTKHTNFVTRLNLTVKVDGVTIADWGLNLEFGSVGEDKTTYRHS